MDVVCLDVEGVLFPELWVELGKATGIPELFETTRETPDLDRLMAKRIDALQRNGVRFVDVMDIVSRVKPLDGAVEFLQSLTRVLPIMLVSDSFYEFLLPLFSKICCPTIACHNLIVDSDGYIRLWKRRLNNQKPHVVNAMKGLGFYVFAAGDSYNDVEMIKAADHGFLINAPQHIQNLLPDVVSFDCLENLEQAIMGARTKSNSVFL